MTKIPFCRRRQPYGLWQLQVQLTRFNHREQLLRISLRTKCDRQARRLVLRLLPCLIAMQSPEALNAEIDHLLKTAREFLDQGFTARPHDVQVFAHFARAANRTFEGWYANNPCPVRYARLYQRHAEVVAVLNELAETANMQLIESGDDLDENYFRPPPRKVVEVELEDIPEETFIRYTDVPKQWADVPIRLAPPDDWFDKESTGKSNKPARAYETQDAPPTTKRASLPDVKPSLPRSCDKASELLTLAIAAMNALRANRLAEKDVLPYVEFLIHVLGDRPLNAYTKADFQELSIEIGKIPVPSDGRRNLAERYAYARANPHLKLQPISKNTIENRVFAGLRAFFRWCIDNDHWVGDIPNFNA